MNDENITNNSEEELSDNIITLTDEDGKESNFELLDLVELDNEEYVVLLPVDDEESEEPLTKVFEIFKDKFKNEFDFVD